MTKVDLAALRDPTFSDGLTATQHRDVLRGGPDPRVPEPVTPTDNELLELMPQQFRDDLATVSRLAAHNTTPDVTPGIFRVSLNTGALGFARAVWAAAERAAPPVPLPVAQPKPVAPTEEALLECAAKALGYRHIPKSETCLTAEADELLAFARAVLARYGTPANNLAPAPVARPFEEWHEDDGPVMCWRFPIEEPPYIGCPLDTDWDGYYTHWTPLVCPADPTIPADVRP
jgi:hypothetical protein